MVWNNAVALDEVLARPDVWCGDRLARAAIPTVSSGFAELDAELPGGGWPRGTLIELLADRVGIGEFSLLMPALARLREEARWSVLVAPPHALNGPALAACGIDLARLAVVAPTRTRDALWAVEQALSSGIPGTVLCWAKQIEAAHVRRLQVAASGSTTLTFLFRPGRAKTESSAATLRLDLSAGPSGRLGVNLLKRRGPPSRRMLYLDVPRPVKLQEDDESTVARAPSSPASARSQRPVALA